MKLLLFLLLLPITIDAVILGGGGGRRGRGRPRFSSSSWSSESRERPPRPPRPDRPPPVQPDPKYVCETGYLHFVRPQGDWCVKVFAASGKPDQPTCERMCQSRGTTLTGLQNNDERLKLAEEGLRIANERGLVVAGLWLGAQSRPGCKISGCSARQAFVWTDNHTTGTDGFVGWGRGEPDTINWPGEPVCIQQFIIAPSFFRGSPPGLVVSLWQEWIGHFQNGNLDKYSCSVGYTPSPEDRMYACGKPAVLE